MKILILLTIVLISSCSSINYVNIHKDLFLAKNCQFEKFTEDEKGSMIQAVGRKIYRNNETCRLRQERNDFDLKSHNEAHNDKN